MRFAIILLAFMSLCCAGSAEERVDQENIKQTQSQIVLKYFDFNRKIDKLNSDLIKTTSVKNFVVRFSDNLKVIHDSELAMPKQKLGIVVSINSILEKNPEISSSDLRSQPELSDLQFNFYQGRFYQLSDQFKFGNPDQGASEPQLSELELSVKDADEKIRTFLEKQDEYNFDAKCSDIIQLIFSYPSKPDKDKQDFREKVKNCVSYAQKYLDNTKANFAEVDNIFSSISENTKDMIKKIDDKIGTTKAQIQDINTKILDLQKEASNTDILAQKGLVIDDSASYVILMTLVAWTAIIFLIVGSIYLIMKISAEKDIRFAEGFSFILFLEMMTVFLLTGTILILGIAGKLNTEGLAALIGGISGYVLGRIHSNRDRQISEGGSGHGISSSAPPQSSQ